jgi:hypothetical protein
LTALALANGRSETRTFDQRYYPSTIQVAGLERWTYSDVDPVGNIRQIDATPDCEATVALDGQTFSTEETVAACDTLSAINTTVQPPGPITFTAGCQATPTFTS